MPAYDKDLVVKTPTAIIASAVAAASISILRQPLKASYIKVTLAGGTSNSGTVTLTGTLAGVAKSEVLQFTAARSKISTLEYDFLSPIATTGLADEATKPTIIVEAVDASGNPIWTATTSTYYVCRLHRVESQSQMIALAAAGQIAPALYKVEIEGEVQGLELNQEVTISAESSIGTFKINSTPSYRYYLGTDLISKTEFYAIGDQ